MNNEEKIKSLNQKYKSEKKLGLINSNISFKYWLNNIFKKDKEQQDTEPDKPTDYSDKKMKIHIFGINAWVFAGTVVALSVIFFTARHYYLKKHKTSATAT